MSLLILLTLNVITYAEYVTTYAEYATTYVEYVTTYAEFVTIYVEYVTTYAEYVTTYVEYVTTYIKYLTTYVEYLTTYVYRLPPSTSNNERKASSAWGSDQLCLMYQSSYEDSLSQSLCNVCRRDRLTLQPTNPDYSEVLSEIFHSLP